MKDKNASYRRLRRTTAAAVLSFSCFAVAQTSASLLHGPIGPGNVIVHSKFGGQIFGFDVDQNGTEGLLSESHLLSNGNILSAVETFDQKTGKILKVVTETETQDDNITMGVLGKSVGLIEHEHPISIGHIHRSFHILNPLAANKFTGVWTPPIGSTHIITAIDGSISRTQGVANAVAWAADVSGSFTPWVFKFDVAKNTFGRIVKITDSNNFGSVVSPIAFDTKTSRAVVGGGTGAFDTNPVIGLIDLTKGKFSEFTGIGFGFVNGVAVDSADGIACTTTEDDASVEFYDLKTETGFTVVLPGSGGQQFLSGWDVEFDSIHKLFIVAQPNSSTGTGSSIYVYDTKGNVKNTLNGFSFLTPMRIALNPRRRTGFVDGPVSGEIQSFAY
jgi:hypothetical protein